MTYYPELLPWRRAPQTLGFFEQPSNGRHLLEAAETCSQEVNGRTQEHRTLDVERLINLTSGRNTQRGHLGTSPTFSAVIWVTANFGRYGTEAPFSKHVCRNLIRGESSSEFLKYFTLWETLEPPSIDLLMRVNCK